MERKRLLERAKFLRSNMTKEENILWHKLRAKRFCQFKFYRQKVIGNYIVDFICPSKQLIIELDGSQHNEINQQKYDEERTKFLYQQGFRVIRFWNNEIYCELNSVLEAIWYALNNPLSPSENPSDFLYPLPIGERDR